MSDPSSSAAFARDGYLVLRGVLDADTIAALRRDAARRCAGHDLEQDSTLWVHDLRELPLCAPARMQADAYLELRAQGGEACPLMARALMKTLPAAAALATGWGDDGWRLFNEHYVIKPPGGGQHFLWHRDADRHLRCAERSRRADSEPKADADEPGAEAEADAEEPEEEPVEGHFYAGPPPAAAVPYVNTWAPLDPCSADSGTLCLLPASSPHHRDSGQPAARPCSLDACEREHGAHMALQPGDVCVFASYVFHTSRPNASPVARRVHYASWSLGAVCWGRGATQDLARAMARRPTAAVPSRRYELLSSLRRPRRATAAAGEDACGPLRPPLMFAVPVQPEAASLASCVVGDGVADGVEDEAGAQLKKRARCVCSVAQ